MLGKSFCQITNRLTSNLTNRLKILKHITTFLVCVNRYDRFVLKTWFLKVSTSYGSPSTYLAELTDLEVCSVWHVISWFGALWNY